MDLVDKEQRLATARHESIAGFFQNLAQFLYSVCHGTQLTELAAALARQQSCQRRLAGAWRPIEDDGPEAIGLEEPA